MRRKRVKYEGEKKRKMPKKAGYWGGREGGGGEGGREEEEEIHRGKAERAEGFFIKKSPPEPKDAPASFLSLTFSARPLRIYSHPAL